MDMFDEELNMLLENSIKYMLGNSQKELNGYHVAYIFFKDLPVIPLIDTTVNLRDTIKKIEEKVNSTKNTEGDTNLSEDLKQVIEESSVYCMTVNSIDKKINKFYLMKAIINNKNYKDFFASINFTNDKNDFLISYFSGNPQKEKKPPIKRKLGENLSNAFKEKNAAAEEKNDATNFLINLNEKYLTTNYLFQDFDEKIPEIIETLMRKEKSNPLLIGKPGVGKTALIEGLIKKIQAKDVPVKLRNKLIYEINLSALLAGTNFRGDFEKRFQNIVDLLSKNKNIILFVDEIHCLQGLGSTNKGDLDLSNMLKPYLSSGEISCIGATTFEEYKNTIGKDKALNRRFQIIKINEPNKDITFKLVKNKKNIYEKFHNVKVPDDLIKHLIDLTDRFITKGNFPDKAFDILDLSCTTAEISNSKTVDIDMIVKNISKISGVSKDQIYGYDKLILSLETNLKNEIFGQEDQIKDICKKILISKAGLSSPNKPLASFLLIGSTGVGKTEIVNQISRELSMNLIRFDMSEFAERGSSSKLIGTSAGYIGYEDGGKLTEGVYHNPYSIILLDEIEKSDKSIFNLFLQVLDNGELTDGMGKTVDFRNTIIFMTSNVGSELSGNGLGLNPTSDTALEKSINNTFSPEFRNRLSKIIKFSSLTVDSMNKLVDKSLISLKEKLKLKNIEVEFSNKIKEILSVKGFDSKLGARPLERYIEDNISYLIAKNIMELNGKNSLYLDYDGEKFTVN